MNRQQSHITRNALKIVETMVNRNVVAGTSISVKGLREIVGFSQEDFDRADTYLLQKKYVSGTMGGEEGQRWLTAAGIDFYENHPDEASDHFSQQKPLNLTAKESSKATEGLPSRPVTDTRKVFVVYGRNGTARNAMFQFLHSIHLDPIEWSQAIAMTGKATPYVGEILDVAFSHAQAVVVLLTGDDEARLQEKYLDDKDSPYEHELTPQARPNVLFEAGMAFGKDQDHTVIVQIGSLRPFSDIAGRHVVHLTNLVADRQALAQRLDAAGCAVNLTGTDWHTFGDFGG